MPPIWRQAQNPGLPRSNPAHPRPISRAQEMSKMINSTNASGIGSILKRASRRLWLPAIGRSSEKAGETVGQPLPAKTARQTYSIATQQRSNRAAASAYTPSRKSRAAAPVGPARSTAVITHLRFQYIPPSNFGQMPSAVLRPGCSAAIFPGGRFRWKRLIRLNSC